jgi:hypothetical protein
LNKHFLLVKESEPKGGATQPTCRLNVLFEGRLPTVSTFGLGRVNWLFRNFVPAGDSSAKQSREPEFWKAQTMSAKHFSMRRK